ncbi:MAG: hypothetical protein NVSMB9_19400 [Isosphaeraceae bacterium]
MKPLTRVAVRLPDALSEVCLVRMGLQARGLAAWFLSIRLARAIAGSAEEARVLGAGLLLSESFRLGWGHLGVLQYWRSFDDLEAWSHRAPHAEWWRAAVDRMRNKGDLGVYHETYLVPRQNVESIFLGCAPAGLLAFGVTGEPVGAETNGRSRLGRGLG